MAKICKKTVSSKNQNEENGKEIGKICNKRETSEKQEKSGTKWGKSSTK